MRNRKSIKPLSTAHKSRNPKRNFFWISERLDQLIQNSKRSKLEIWDNRATIIGVVLTTIFAILTVGLTIKQGKNENQLEALESISQSILAQNKQLIEQNELVRQELYLLRKSFDLDELNAKTQSERRKKDNQPILHLSSSEGKNSILRNDGESVRMLRIKCLDNKDVSVSSEEIFPKNGKLFLRVDAPDSTQIKHKYRINESDGRGRWGLKQLRFELFMQDRDGRKYKQQISYGYVCTNSNSDIPDTECRYDIEILSNLQEIVEK